FVLNDGTDAGPAATKTVSVAAVDDPPVATTSAGTTTAPEQVATVVDAGIAVADPDSATLASATVAIVGNFQSGEDVLAFPSDGLDRAHSPGSSRPGPGVLALPPATATATLAQWQAALRAVTYADSSDAPVTADRPVSFVLNDGTDAGRPRPRRSPSPR